MHLVRYSLLQIHDKLVQYITAVVMQSLIKILRLNTARILIETYQNLCLCYRKCRFRYLNDINARDIPTKAYTVHA